MLNEGPVRRALINWETQTMLNKFRTQFRNRHKVVEGCNWLMVGIAALWVASVFAGLLSSPSDSQAIWRPPPVVQRALPAELEPVPTWGPGDRAAKGSNRSANSRQLGAASGSAAQTPSTSGLEIFFIQGPEVPIPALTPLPLGVGPDF